MTIKTASNINDEFIDELLNIWEASVKATHHFLANDDIYVIKPQVRQALTAINAVMYAVDEKGCICGFMAVEDSIVKQVLKSL